MNAANLNELKQRSEGEWAKNSSEVTQQRLQVISAKGGFAAAESWGAFSCPHTVSSFGFSFSFNK